MPETGFAYLAILLFGLIFGPVYIAGLVVGFALRKKLILNKPLQWLFIASLPLAMLCFVPVIFFGSKETNTASTLGQICSWLAYLFVLVGGLSLVLIIVQSVRRPTNR